MVGLAELDPPYVASSLMTDRPNLPSGVKWKIRPTSRGCLDAVSIESTV
jgi:hypothetical protein